MIYIACTPHDCYLQMISLFIGNVLNLFLYGVLTVQLYLYFVSFPNDRKLFKAVVYTVYGIETIYTVLVTYDLGTLLISSYVEEPKLPSYYDYYRYPVLSLITVPVCGGIVAFLTQAMYAYRVQVVAKLKWLSWCIIAGIVAQLLAILIMAPMFSFDLVVLVWTSVCLLVDLIITVIMVRSLRRNEISSKKLRSKVTRLIYLIVGTGALTVTTNIATLIGFAIPPRIPLGPAIVLSKVYANSMMVLVNDRRPCPRSQDDRGRDATVTVHLSPLQCATMGGMVNSTEERGPRYSNEAEDDSWAQTAPASRSK